MSRFIDEYWVVSLLVDTEVQSETFISQADAVQWIKDVLEEGGAAIPENITVTHGQQVFFPEISIALRTSR